MTAQDHISLSAFLQPLTRAVHDVATSTWVVAEISEFRDGQHAYITLIETNATGKTMASLKASLWASSKAKLLKRFAAATGGELLRKGLKIRVLLNPGMHLLYGLGATIEDLDPTYTLGDAARKLIELRKRLRDEGLYDKQRQLNMPSDFTRVAVLCPPGAAGLGDFKSHADPLEMAGLCQFDYFSATFQGERTATEVVAGLRAIYRAHRDSTFDSLIVLRGGGAQADLAWLNEYEIARAITHMPMPVMVAIGHERDQTILDEVAHQSIHTPSKAIERIASQILGNAQRAIADLEAIVAATNAAVSIMALAINQARDVLQNMSRHHMRVAADSVAGNRHAIVAGAQSAIEREQLLLDTQANQLQWATWHQHEQVAMTVSNDIDNVGPAAASAVQGVEHGVEQAQEIIRGRVVKDIAVTEAMLIGLLGLIRDRSCQGQSLVADQVRLAAAQLDSRARIRIAREATDIAGYLSLTRDRSVLATQTLRERVQGDAELVLGFGPSKTLQRGFVITRTNGKPLTRRNQVVSGGRIELQFADGKIGATIH